MLTHCYDGSSGPRKQNKTNNPPVGPQILQESQGSNMWLFLKQNSLEPKQHFAVQQWQGTDTRTSYNLNPQVGSSSYTSSSNSNLQLIHSLRLVES